MAITYPRSFPVLTRLFTDCTFDLERYEAVNEFPGGYLEAADVGDPRWVATYTTVPVNRDNAQIWEAWRDSLKGSQKVFRGYHAERPFPKAFPTGFAGLVVAITLVPFVGTAIDVTAVTSTTVAVAGLPANFPFKAGDMFELDQGAFVGLYRILEDETANSSGVLTMDAIEPTVKTNLFTAAATMNLVRPACLMKLDAKSWEASRGADPPYQPITFSARQKVA